MHIPEMAKAGMGMVARIVMLSLAAATLAGCASVFNVQVLYEAPQPGVADSPYVMRLEKEENPVTGAKEDFPVRQYNISEARVKKMMAAMYRRFFKDPETFEPPNESFIEDITDALVESAVDSVFGKRKKPKKNMSSSYRPELSEDGHPASMSKPKRVFSRAEIDALAPQIAKAFAELRIGEHLTLRTRAFPRQENGELKWNKSEDVTSVAIRFQPAGKFLGVPHEAAITWNFYEVHGLDFRGQGGKVYTYTTSEGAVNEEWDFLAVFPRKKGDVVYWRVEFPVK